MGRTVVTSSSPSATISSHAISQGGGVSTTAVEDLAQVPRLEEQAFALRQSILQDPRYEEQEHACDPYRYWRILLMMLGMVLALINKGYTIFLWSKYFYWKRARLLNSEKEKWLKNQGWLGAPGLCSWLDNSGRLWERLRMGVTTFVALDVLYAKQIILPAPPPWGKGRLAWLVITSPEPQAVTNRLKITARRISAELERLYNSGKKDIAFAALASGSAQAVIETVARFVKKYPDARVQLSLVDTNPEALAMASALAAARGLELPSETFQKMHLLKFLDKCGTNSFDLVEMVGFLDYRTEVSLKKLCSEIRRVLKPAGMFITAHIAPSKWAFVVRWVINWPGLIRRTPEAFRNLLIASGFQPCEIELELELHNIHTVAYCRKEA